MTNRSIRFIALSAVLAAFSACDDDPVDETAADTGSQDTTSDSSSNDTSNEDMSASDSSTSDSSTNDMAQDNAEDGEAPDCFDFWVDEVAAIDGVFGEDSLMWRRPYDEDELVCPAGGLLPESAGEVPYVVYSFCNNEDVDLTYDILMQATDGPDGEPPLDDPVLYLYEGIGIPDDPTACLVANDDLDALGMSSDAGIEGVVVSPGAQLTIVGTAFQYDSEDGTGEGGYVLVVEPVE